MIASILDVLKRLSKNDEWKRGTRTCRWCYWSLTCNFVIFLSFRPQESRQYLVSWINWLVLVKKNGRKSNVLQNKKKFLKKRILKKLWNLVTKNHFKKKFIFLEQRSVHLRVVIQSLKYKLFLWIRSRIDWRIHKSFSSPTFVNFKGNCSHVKKWSWKARVRCLFILSVKCTHTWIFFLIYRFIVLLVVGHTTCECSFNRQLKLLKKQLLSNKPNN